MRSRTGRDLVLCIIVLGLLLLGCREWDMDRSAWGPRIDPTPPSMLYEQSIQQHEAAR